MYRTVKKSDLVDLPSTLVKRLSDGAYVPLDAPDNTDYIAYLAWLEAGNTPEAAE